MFAYAPAKIATHARSSSSRLHQPRLIVGAARRQFNYAIVREVPDSFEDALGGFATIKEKVEPVDLELARDQHKRYVQELRKRVPVLSLPALEEYPDSCFVEDTVVTLGKKAVLTRMGHPSRQGEVDSIKQTLLRLGMQVTDMREVSDTATCDGGDVIITRRHMFVGLSTRTNQEAIEILKDVLLPPDKELVIVPSLPEAADQFLHLKSAVSAVDQNVLIAPKSKVGIKILNAMEHYRRGYQIYRLKEVICCNGFFLRNLIFAQFSDNFESRKELEKVAKEEFCDLLFLSTSEFAKKDGGLSSLSIRLDI